MKASLPLHREAAARLADRITGLRVTRGTEDYARIGSPPGRGAFVPTLNCLRNGDFTYGEITGGT